MTTDTPTLHTPTTQPQAAGVPAPSIQFTLDVHDIVAAVRLQIDHDPQLRRHVRIMRLGLPAITILLAWAAVGLGASPIWLIGAGLIALLFYTRTSGATRAGVAKAIQKRYKQGSPRGIVGRHEMIITQTGLVERTEVNESTHRWEGLDRVIDTGDCLFIYVTPFAAHILPRARVDAGDYGDFVQALGQHVTVRQVVHGESFQRAKAAGQDAKPIRRQPSMFVGTLAIGVLASLLWSGVAGELIATMVIPGNWPEPLWWLAYNFLISLPGVAAAAGCAAGWADRNRETRCRRCGHLLRGLTQPRCSECGEDI